ncbi:hypothetical protein [Vibrio fluvialis]|uniref:hypothetical protein n=1 Tax=Vibrio fluvialis TaxID=676 RepID=UPI0012ADC473|nr:hypothetical protein [Vibrio fluvialis]
MNHVSSEIHLFTKNLWKLENRDLVKMMPVLVELELLPNQTQALAADGKPYNSLCFVNQEKGISIKFLHDRILSSVTRLQMQDCTIESHSEIIDNLIEQTKSAIKVAFDSKGSVDFNRVSLVSKFYEIEKYSEFMRLFSNNLKPASPWMKSDLKEFSYRTCEEIEISEGEKVNKIAMFDVGVVEYNVNGNSNINDCISLQLDLNTIPENNSLRFDLNRSIVKVREMKEEVNSLYSDILPLFS